MSDETKGLSGENPKPDLPPTPPKPSLATTEGDEEESGENPKPDLPPKPPTP